MDCEAVGPCPSLGRLTWFGAVDFDTDDAFNGLIVRCRPSKENPAVPDPMEEVSWDDYAQRSHKVFTLFAEWLSTRGAPRPSSNRPVMVSDNPAFDWQWINDGFWRATGGNPFGHSARRIGDFYAGLTDNFRNTQRWKRLRVTPHDHDPVNDARGNCEAFRRMLLGER